MASACRWVGIWRRRSPSTAQIIGPAWSGRTLGDVIDRYRAQVLPLKRSAATRLNEGVALDRLKRFAGHMLPDNLTAPMLYRYMDERRRAGWSTSAGIGAARDRLARACLPKGDPLGRGLGESRPWHGEGRQEAETPARADVASSSSVRALATERMRVAIDLAVCMGPRRGDLLTLTRSSLTDEGIAFTQGKTQRPQLIEWSDELRRDRRSCEAPEAASPGRVSDPHARGRAVYAVRLLGQLAAADAEARRRRRSALHVPRSAQCRRGRRDARGSARSVGPCERRDDGAVLSARRAARQAACMNAAACSIAYGPCHRVTRSVSPQSGRSSASILPGRELA